MSEKPEMPDEIWAGHTCASLLGHPSKAGEKYTAQKQKRYKSDIKYIRADLAATGRIVPDGWVAVPPGLHCMIAWMADDEANYTADELRSMAKKALAEIAAAQKGQDDEVCIFY